MGFLINGQPLFVGRPFTDANGTQYPSNWLRHASEEEKAAIGITWEADPVSVDQRFYWSEGNPKRLEDEPAVDKNGDAILDADGNQVINQGLKTVWVAKQKKIAGTLLAGTDWYVVRKAEDSTAEIPAAVATYRAAVRTTSGTREGQINACTTTDELSALLTNSAQVYDEATDSMVANTEPFITPWPEQG